MNLNFNNILFMIALFIGLYMTLYMLITIIENWGNHKTPRRKRNFPKVCIIVPCFNEENTLEKTMNSLLQLEYPKNKLEFIIVDDGSSDNTYNIALKYKSKGVKVYKKVNGGKHTALNFALKKTNAELVGALDADSTVAKDALIKITSYFSNKRVMAVTPSMIINKPKGILKRIQYSEYLLGCLLRRVFADVGSQHVTPGPFTIYKKEFFDKYGYYRKAHMTEDIEVALRIQTHNYLIENATDAYVYTHGPSTFYALYRQRLRWYAGFIKNILDYKHLFGPKHGNLGLFILPINFLSIGLMGTILVYTCYKLINSLIINIQKYLLINFDISKLFTLKFDTFFINSDPLTILGLVALILSITTIWLAKHFAKEKNIAYSYLLFTLFYTWLYVFWWAISLAHVCFKKKLTWGHKSVTGA